MISLGWSSFFQPSSLFTDSGVWCQWRLGPRPPGAVALASGLCQLVVLAGGPGKAGLVSAQLGPVLRGLPGGGAGHGLRPEAAPCLATRATGQGTPGRI